MADPARTPPLTPALTEEQRHAQWHREQGIPCSEVATDPYCLAAEASAKRHRWSERGSRYNLRCDFCDVSSLDPRAGEPCASGGAGRGETG